MLIKLQQVTQLAEVELLVRYAKMDVQLEKLLAYANSLSLSIQCNYEGETLWVAANDILYIESVDKRTYVYTKASVFRTDLRLYQFLSQLGDAGMVQVSKFCIVNLGHLLSIKTLPNTRMEGLLSGGEKVTINRKYIADIKQNLLPR